MGWLIGALLLGFAAGLYAGLICSTERLRGLRWEARMWRTVAERLQRELDDET